MAVGILAADMQHDWAGREALREQAAVQAASPVDAPEPVIVTRTTVRHVTPEPVVVHKKVYRKVHSTGQSKDPAPARAAVPRSTSGKAGTPSSRRTVVTPAPRPAPARAKAPAATTSTSS